MANNWLGYFLTIPATSGTEAQKKAFEKAHAFPMKYIAQDSWDGNPNVREEIKAYRDDNTRNLTRITASGMKSGFSFKTLGGISLGEKIAILKWFTDNESDAHQRKITLKYWDDENSAYKTGTFYRANPKFRIEGVTETDIRYGSVEFTFAEY